MDGKIFPHNFGFAIKIGIEIGLALHLFTLCMRQKSSKIARLKNQSTCVHKMAAISKDSDCWNATIKPRARNRCFHIQLMYIDECVIAIYGRWLPIACCSHTALPIPISHFPFPLVESLAFILISDFSMHYSIIHAA